MLRWFEHSQVYHPGRTLITSGAELGRPFEEAWFTAADGVSLNGWFFPAKAGSPRAHLVVLYCHGNGGNISHRLGGCQFLLQAGLSVFVFDYRGYGRSQGRPSEEGTYLDAQAAYRWLQGKGFAGQHILAYGESLGGGVAAELALREPAGSLILQSTFTSIPDIGAELFPWLPVRRLAFIKYDTVRKLPRVQMPVLVLHSRADELIGFHHGERLFAAAREPKRFCEIQGDHNNPLAQPEPFAAGLEAFLRQLEEGALQAPAPLPAFGCDRARSTSA